MRSVTTLRVILGVTTFVWLISADVCALNDQQLECRYGAGFHQHESDGAPGSNVMPDDDCPHPLAIQLPVEYHSVVSMAFIGDTASVAHDLKSFNPVDHSPPTPPPI